MPLTNALMVLGLRPWICSRCGIGRLAYILGEVFDAGINPTFQAALDIGGRMFKLNFGEQPGQAFLALIQGCLLIPFGQEKTQVRIGRLIVENPRQRTVEIYISDQVTNIALRRSLDPLDDIIFKNPQQWMYYEFGFIFRSIGPR